MISETQGRRAMLYYSQLRELDELRSMLQGLNTDETPALGFHLSVAGKEMKAVALEPESFIFLISLINNEMLVRCEYLASLGFAMPVYETPL